MSRPTIAGYDLTFMGGTFLLKSYSTNSYGKEEQVTLKAEKAVDWVLQQLLLPCRKVVIYKKRFKYRFLGCSRNVGWQKLMEVCS